LRADGVEQVVRDYFDSLETGDVALFCKSIKPEFGPFSDEDECRDAWSFTGLYPPRYKEYVGENIRTERLAFSGTDFRYPKASTLGSMVWRADGPAGVVELGMSRLLFHLEYSFGAWKIINIVAPPDALDVNPEHQAAVSAATDLYGASSLLGPAYGTALCEAIALRASGFEDADDCMQRVGYPPLGRSGLGDHKTRPVLGGLGSIETKNDRLRVMVDILLIDNGALAYPQRAGVELALEDGEWGVVR
jgi:hypothetical protein